MSRAKFVIFIVAVVLLIEATGDTQEYPRFEYRPKSEALRRFYSTRGAERLPSVELKLEPTTVEEAYLSILGRAPVIVHGALGWQEQITDNAFLGNAARLGGGVPGNVFHIISPSVRLEIPSKTLPIFFNYGIDIIRAGNYEHEFGTEEHHIGGTAELKLGSIKLRANDALERLSIPPRHPSATVVNYWNNVSDIILEWRPGPLFRSTVWWTHELTRFDRSDYKVSDFDLDRIGVEFYYKLFPKASVMAEYQHEFIDEYGKSRDAERYRVGGGIEWDITSRLSGIMKAGHEWYDLKNAPSGAEGVYWHAALSYALSKNLLLSLYLDRSIALTSKASGDLVYGGTFTSTQYALKALYRMSPQVSVMGEFFWMDDKSPPGFTSPRRHSYTKGVALGLDWEPVRYLRFGAKYRFQRIDSTIRSEEFKENMLMLNASFGF